MATPVLRAIRQPQCSYSERGPERSDAPRWWARVLFVR